MKIKIELGGGLELLFNKEKNFMIVFDEGNKTIRDVIKALERKIIEKPELFCTKECNIKPGIIVLYNDSDWEIYQKENTEIKDGDLISFISTLHGG